MAYKHGGRSGRTAEILTDQRSNKEWDNQRTRNLAGNPGSTVPPLEHNLTALERRLLWAALIDSSVLIETLEHP